MERFCGWAETEYRVPARSLAVVRVVVALYLLTPPSGFAVWVSRMPASFYDPPPSPLMFFTAFPPEWVMIALGVLQTVGLVLVLFGAWTLPASLLTAGVLLLGSGIAFSIGKIDHGQMVPWSFVALGLASWGRAWSFDAWRRRSAGRVERGSVGWPMAWLAFVLSVGYLTAAIPKALSGWLHPEAYATYDRLVRHAVAQQRSRPLSQWLMEYPGWWWKVPDYATVVAEAGLILLLPRRRWFLMGLLVIIGFHAGVFTMMEILFSANFVAIGALYNYERLQLAASARLPSPVGPWRRGVWCWVVGLALVVVAWRLNLTPGWQFLDRPYRVPGRWHGPVLSGLVTLVALVWAYGACFGDARRRPLIG